MGKYQLILREEYLGTMAIVLMMFIFSIFTAIGILVIKKKLHDRKERIATIIICIILILMMLGIGSYETMTALKIKQDMENNLFITYFGEYELVYDRTFTICYIHDNDNDIYIELRCISRPQSGSYTGYVVYSKNSLYVVDIYE